MRTWKVILGNDYQEYLISAPDAPAARSFCHELGIGIYTCVITSISEAPPGRYCAVPCEPVPVLPGAARIMRKVTGTEPNVYFAEKKRIKEKQELARETESA